MVILILTKEGFSELGYFAGESKCPIWLNHGVLSQTEIDSFRKKGFNITNFYHEILLDDYEALKEALCTISEHHPDERIWVEFQGKI